MNKIEKNRQKVKKYYWEVIKKNPDLLKKYKEKVQKAVKLWREKNPEKNLAQRKVFIALRNKTLKKSKCFCGNSKSEAHHEDYLKPLEVIWLCKKHHVKADRERK